MLRSLALLLVLAPALFWTPQAHACRCVSEDLEQAKQRSLMIFEGRVLSVAEDEVRFRITQAWKGVEDEELTIHPGRDTCRRRFEVDTSYLVFVREFGGFEVADSCTRTKRIEDAEEDLSGLGSGVIPVDPLLGPDLEPEEAGLDADLEDSGCSVGHANLPMTLVGTLWLGLMVMARRRSGRQA